MTAEVAILNRNAVALAADSAVTLRLPSETKIYQTNKLFALSKFEPVGVMVYGSADFMGLPWETIVKRYRAELGPKSFGNVRQYGADFLRFLEGNDSFFPARRQEQFVYEWARSWARILKHRLANKLENRFKAGSIVSEREVRASFRRIFAEELKHLGRHKKLQRLRALSAARTARLYRSQIALALRQELQKLTDVVPQSDIVSAAALAMTLGNYWFNESGIVIAGFGSKEFLPSLRCYTADLIVAGKLRAIEETRKRSDISGECSAVVTAFAQGDMVSLFMNGIDDDYSEFVRSFIGESFLVRYPDLFSKLAAKYLSGTPKSARESLLKHLREAGIKLVSALESGITQYAREICSSPIIQIVEHLPKEELAAMAEALVNLTSFKRHVTGQAETVGGPIDVAVISRGDGLVWIKRKHYFRQELNQHFLSNYYNDVGGGTRK